MKISIEKKTRYNIYSGFLITFFTIAIMIFRFPIFEHIDEKLYDYGFKLRGVVDPPDNIIIAAIDEKGTEKVGRWSWKRETIEELIKKTEDAGAAVTVFDSVFIFGNHEKSNKRLIDTVKEPYKIILPFIFDFKQNIPLKSFNMTVLRDSSFLNIEDRWLLDKYKPLQAKGILMSASDANGMSSLGHVNIIAERDGVTRRETLVVEHNGLFYPSIVVQAVAAYLGVPRSGIVLKASRGISIGDRYFSTDRKGRILINYSGPEQTFRYLSVSDILDGTIGSESLKGKIVLIGSTVTGTYDTTVTPFSPLMPGVEKIANAIATLLDQKSIETASLTTNLMIILLSGILFTILIAELKAFGSIGILLPFIFLIFYSGYYLFVEARIWLNITYPSFNIMVIFMTVNAINYLKQEREAKTIKSIFSSYVTEKVVKELIKDPEASKVGFKRREITILFADLKGFTPFAEKYPPEEVFSLLNEYLGTMTDTVFIWNGTLNKFIGDTVVAFWGAPTEQSDHAELAIKCALNMVKKFGDLQRKWQAEGKPDIGISIGVNTGDALVGNIGSEGKKIEYSIIGDSVNLCSRVESLTRKYDTKILITEFTMNKIKDSIERHIISHISVKGLENVRVKGREKSVKLYEVKTLEHGIESEVV